MPLSLQFRLIMATSQRPWGSRQAIRPYYSRTLAKKKVSDSNQAVPNSKQQGEVPLSIASGVRREPQAQFSPGGSCQSPGVGF